MPFFVLEMNFCKREIGLVFRKEKLASRFFLPGPCVCIEQQVGQIIPGNPKAGFLE